jgi:hypothetical protein
VQQAFVLHTQNSTTFVLPTQKSAPKSRPIKVCKKTAKKVAKKRRQKGGKKGARKAAQNFIPEPVLLLP